MSKWKPAKKGPKKTQMNRARQIGCIVWLVMALGMILWAFYAIVRRPG